MSSPLLGPAATQGAEVTWRQLHGFAIRASPSPLPSDQLMLASPAALECFDCNTRHRQLQASGGAGLKPVHRAPSRPVPCTFGRPCSVHAAAAPACIGKPRLRPAAGGFSPRTQPRAGLDLLDPLPRELCPALLGGGRTRGGDTMTRSERRQFLGLRLTTDPWSAIVLPAVSARAGTAPPLSAPHPSP